MFYPKHMQGVNEPWEQLPAAAGEYKAGQLLGVSNGKLVALSAATKTTPPYLCMADCTVTAGGLVPVARINKEHIYVTTLSAETASAKLGALLEVTAGGLQADGAAAGTFEVVHVEGTAAGSEVHGRFQ